jgi:hypothetical protein
LTYQGSLNRNAAIEALSENLLLEIFDLCLPKDEHIDPWYSFYEEDQIYLYDAWYTLVHVCQRWRNVALASPRRLNLRLLCPRRRRVRETLGVWPAFPIVIWDFPDFPSDEDNIIAALGHRNRVCEIKLKRFTRLQSEELLGFMEESFPVLTNLQIKSYWLTRDEPPIFPDSFLDGSAPRLRSLDLPILPDSFLGGSAPRLRSLYLESVSFPALPNLLLSASHLVQLHLSCIPMGFISPEMAAALSVLTRVEHIHLVFGSPPSHSGIEDRSPLPLTRSVLPALKWLRLEGDGKYLDDFVARIDVPSINYLGISLTDRPFSLFDLFHLPKFIGRAENFRSLDYAAIELGPGQINVTVAMHTLAPGSGVLQLKVLYFSPDGPLPTLVQACSPSLLPLSTTQRLNITTQFSYWQSHIILDTGCRQWVDILRTFSAARSLSLGSMHIVPPIAFMLKQIIDEGMTDVLPAIQKLFVATSVPAGPVREAIGQFVAARGLPDFEKPASSG